MAERRKAAKRKTLPKVRRPLFTRQEYGTIVDCLSMVKMIGENSHSLAEKRGCRAMIPHSAYHVGIIDKLYANTEPEPAPRSTEIPE